MGAMITQHRAEALLDLADRLDESSSISAALDAAGLDIDTIKFRLAGTEDMVEVQLWQSPAEWHLYWPDEED